LSPIENAIEIVDLKSHNLTTELNCTPISPKTFQRELQGALLSRTFSKQNKKITKFSSSSHTFDLKR
jgi:hypothetical protein